MVSSSARALLQSVGDGSQHRIAETVAARVVEDLETVQVHEEQGDRPVPARGQRQAMFDPVHDQHPVRQIGEGIVEDLVLEPQLRCFAVTDVTSDAVHSDDFPVRVKHAAEALVDPDL